MKSTFLNYLITAAFTVLAAFTSCKNNNDYYNIDTVDVYVAGVSYSRATLWKNGVAKNLFDLGVATSVFVSDGDVYVAGWQCNELSICVAKLWKNGVSQELLYGSNNAEANSVFVVKVKVK